MKKVLRSKWVFLLVRLSVLFSVLEFLDDNYSNYLLSWAWTWLVGLP